MPNGHRDSYRLGDIPSPVHTSDSEETKVQKHRWEVLVRWTVQRWRHLVSARRLRQHILLALRVCPNAPPQLASMLFGFLNISTKQAVLNSLLNRSALSVV